MRVVGKDIMHMREPEVPVSRALEIVLSRVKMDRKTADVLRKALDGVREQEMAEIIRRSHEG